MKDREKQSVTPITWIVIRLLREGVFMWAMALTGKGRFSQRCAITQWPTGWLYALYTQSWLFDTFYTIFPTAIMIIGDKKYNLEWFICFLKQGVGNTLKRHYETYLLEYELAHDDVDGECCLLCHRFIRNPHIFPCLNFMLRCTHLCPHLHTELLLGPLIFHLY